jgi:hypothetical protein
MLIDTKKLIAYLKRYKARCDVVRNPDYQAAMIACDDFRRAIDRISRKISQGEQSDSGKERQPCGEHNTAQLAIALMNSIADSTENDSYSDIKEEYVRDAVKQWRSATDKRA